MTNSHAHHTSPLFHSGESWQLINKRDFLNLLRDRPEHSLGNPFMPELLIENGPHHGYRYAVPNSGLILGRDLSCQIQLDDPTLSRFHCRFFVQDGELWVVDQSSANGTFVNNDPIGDRSRVLYVGDVISVGDTILSVVPSIHSSDTIADPLVPVTSLTPARPSPSPIPIDSKTIHVVSNPPSSVSAVHDVPKSRFFPTFQRFKSAPFCVKFASCFLALHVALDFLVSAWYRQTPSLFAYFTAWLLYAVLNAKNYSRLILLVVRLSTVPITLMHIGEPTLHAYIASMIFTLGISIFYLIPLFLPAANLWFHSNSNS